MALSLFLLKVFVISFSGAMQPGPVTATVITMGTRNRYAGILLAIGHAIIELPLMILIVLGMGTLFKSEKTQIAIGLAGGVFLLMMAVHMMISLKAGRPKEDKPLNKKPILAGIILSASNPYFLLWWATVGMRLAMELKEFEGWAFVFFALVHWLCDAAWFQALSWTTFKGSKLLGTKGQRVVLTICALALFAFGLMFIYNAGAGLVNLLAAK